MTSDTEEIPCNFVASFKCGDNLVFNARLLCKLYATNDDGMFNKLIVLQVGSILEAALAQIIYRAKHHTREGVPTISEKDRLEIKGKKLDKFNSVIDVLRKYQVLDALSADIYDDLHTLRRYRNKVHIQDDIGIEDVSKDEPKAFSNELCSWALCLNARILRYLSSYLHRPPQVCKWVHSLLIPSEHGSSLVAKQ